MSDRVNIDYESGDITVGRVTVQSFTTKHPLSLIGKEAGVCWNSNTKDNEKNRKRAITCIKSEHNRTLEYVQIYFVFHDISIKLGREVYTHIGGDPTRLQDSTRRVDITTDFHYITPKSIEKEPAAKSLYEKQMELIRNTEVLLEKFGIPREDASGILPLNMCTKIVWRTNLRQLIDMVHKRTCTKAYWEFRALMEDIKKALLAYSDKDEEWKWIVDNLFVPNCVYLHRCPEDRSCGYYDNYCIKKLKEKEINSSTDLKTNSDNIVK